MKINKMISVLGAFVLLLTSCADKVANSYEEAQVEFCAQNPSKCTSGIAEVSSDLFSSGGISSSNIGISSVAKSSSQMASSSSLSGYTGTYGSLTDSRDGKTYKTVIIGTQTWMAENLNYGTYISDGASSATLQNGAQKFCYNNIESNCTTDGGFYQWHTALALSDTCATKSCSSKIPAGNVQGICPVGWHFPKVTEWNALEVYLGGSGVAGSKVKLNNTGNSSWDASAYNRGNPSGFSALPVGNRSSKGGFGGRGDYASFGYTTENYGSEMSLRNLGNSTSGLFVSGTYKTNGFSVRCVRD